VKIQKDLLANNWEQFELNTPGYEQVLRGTYLNFQQTAFKRNQTGAVLVVMFGH
jgi:hypothetical protein